MHCKINTFLQQQLEVEKEEERARNLLGFNGECRDKTTVRRGRLMGDEKKDKRHRHLVNYIGAQEKREA